MSFLARYLRSRRRRPTSRSRPRRLWWSCLCILRCSVRSEMRLVSIATWTSGEPVSLATVACVDMISVLVALSSGTDLLEGSSELPRFDPRGRKDSRRRRGRPQKATSGAPGPRTRRSGRVGSPTAAVTQAAGDAEGDQDGDERPEGRDEVADVRERRDRQRDDQAA